MPTASRPLFLGLIAFTLLTGCSHAMRITNADQYFSPSSASHSAALKLGITSPNDSEPQNSRYVAAVVEALRRHPNVERVIHPYNEARHRDQVDTVVDIAVSPKYSGQGANFLVNWPGFLIFAPAIWGYGYNADLKTVVNIKQPGTDQVTPLTIPVQYTFRQAEMDRTWTEIGWFEVGIIPLIGGAAFTQYDPDVTDEFITKVSPNYGPYIANKIVEDLPGVQK
jgi:hypothetical protein